MLRHAEIVVQRICLHAMQAVESLVLYILKQMDNPDSRRAGVEISI